LSRDDASARDLVLRMWPVITVLLAGGRDFPDIELVAEKLGTSVRTLQRQLRARCVTYTQVIQRARSAAAQGMLEDPRSKIADVGRALGYSDPAHFTRAFQRWTGVTPREFRGQRAARGQKRGSDRDR
jgi:AraC-like DNA-binding protein